MTTENDPPIPSDNSPGEEARTVFIPAPDLSVRPVAPIEEATSTPPIPPSVAEPRAPEPRPPEPPRAAAEAFHTQFAPRADGQGIQVGDVLNHIFEVKRFIARGGMGEVFEGVNVNTDERVAIKVMLPSLAADPNVIAMFRKEARTLTRLQHEALVQYRVLAQEPQLGVLYIVTEYVDGRNLADVLGTIQATPPQLAGLLRRLASGLRVAHALGAIHRDMSPDNVLLEDGAIEKAKIIDFGIAKDLDPGSATIIGDGFAGKLNYVAPEQLGDFGREVGAWSDVYSLALVVLAVAGGRNVSMGGSLVDAVDKRRAGPDLSAAPAELRPVLDKMLKPNPIDRLRSMDAVIAELDGQAPALVAASAEAPKPKTALIAGSAIGVLVVAGLAWFALKPHGTPVATGGGGGVQAGAVVSTADLVARARAAVDATLPSVTCTWLNIARVEKSGTGVLVALTGVAGNPSAAQNEISRALASQKVGNADINFEEVAPITQSGCAALDTYRQIRSPDNLRLSVPQRKFEMRMQPPGSSYAGTKAANAVLNINVGDPKADFSLVGLEPSGVIDTISSDRAAFLKQAQASVNGRPITTLSGDKFRLQLDLDHIGWSGMLLLTGKGPFDAKLVAPPLGSRGPDWTNKFVAVAANQGWQADMVWFKSVDEIKK